MTLAAFLDLVDQVAEHGGPKLRDHIEGNNMCWTIEEGWAIAVRLLKDDLIERNRYFVTEYAPIEFPVRDEKRKPWYAEIRPDATLNHRAVSMEKGDTELEAVLSAWLAAARAEKWKA